MGGWRFARLCSLLAARLASKADYEQHIDPLLAVKDFGMYYYDDGHRSASPDGPTERRGDRADSLAGEAGSVADRLPLRWADDDRTVRGE